MIDISIEMGHHAIVESTLWIFNSALIPISDVEIEFNAIDTEPLDLA